MGADVKVAKGAHDLGIHLPGVKRRRLGVLGGRLAKTGGTLMRILDWQRNVAAPPT